MYQMRLDRGNGFAFDQNSESFILLSCYEITEPRALRELW